MELKTCEYCGTEYKAELPQCPLCGRSSVHVVDSEPEQKKSRGRVAGTKAVSGKQQGKRVAAKKERIPRWMWAVSCIVLGIAVLIGIFYFCYVMGFFSKNKNEEPVKAPAIQQEPSKPEQTDPQPEQTKPEPSEPEKTEPEKPADPYACTGLTLSRTDITLDERGGYFFLTVLAEPSDCSDPITYSSSDPSVATVEGSGSSCMITAIEPGTTQISVTCGSITKTCVVICDFEPSAEPPKEEQQPGTEPEIPAEPEQTKQPYLNTVDFTLFHPGEETTIVVKDGPIGATYRFSSSNTSVATVSDIGVVKAVGSGTATITVMVDDIKLTCIARCNLADSAETGNGSQTETPPPAPPVQEEPEETYIISHPDVTLFNSGESFTLALYTVTGGDVTGVSWSSSDTSVCTVSAGGTVTAVGAGTAKVRTTYGGTTYTCIVRCTF